MTIMANPESVLAFSQPKNILSWAPTNGPEWLNAVRSNAADQFVSLGLPTMQHEDWRMTSLKTFAEISFSRSVCDDNLPVIAPDDIAFFGYSELPCSTLVFVNGHYRADLSERLSLPDGVVVCDLQEAIASNHPAVQSHLAQHLETKDEAFAALNTAMFESGAFVFVPRNVNAKDPIHILNLTVATSSERLAFFPRNLFVIEEDAEVTIIEDFVCTDEDNAVTYLTNGATEIVAGARSKVHHYFNERESRGAYNISSMRVIQEEDSYFESHSAILGAGLVRNNILPKLAGPNCYSLLNGIYIGEGTQRIDNFMRVEHDSTDGRSRQYFKGILNDHSQASFSGRIVVAEGAQQTDAVQSNQNLLLSDDARAISKPQLEIYADDVKCTHGATIGEIDESALFYLKTRGINETAARSLLLHAFAMESLDRMSLEPIRTKLEGILVDRLPNCEILKGIL